MSILKASSILILVVALAACGKTSTTRSTNPTPVDKAVSSQAPETTPQPAPQQEQPSVPDKQETPKQDESKQEPAAKTQPEDTQTGEPKVVGLGTASKKPEQLLDQGYDAAILRATFCKVTGKFNTDGSRCYLVFSDGHTEYQNAGNKDKIDAFIEQLKTDRIAKKKSKKMKKNRGN